MSLNSAYSLTPITCIGTSAGIRSTEHLQSEAPGRATVTGCLTGTLAHANLIVA